jgi:hypothetical protein
MKKFLLSLCVLAVASACVFMTSCKDEDDTTSNYETMFNAISSLLDPSCTYTFKVGGKSYTTVEDLVQALVATPAGSSVNVDVEAATPNGKKNGSITGTIPAAGQKTTVTYNIPQRGNPKTGHMDVQWNTSAPIVIEQHNGGAAGN